MQVEYLKQQLNCPEYQNNFQSQLVTFTYLETWTATVKDIQFP